MARRIPTKRRWRVHNNICRRLGQPTGAVVSITCTCPAGKRTTALYPLHACEIHGECLPTFQCTAANKQAVREDWTRSDGGDPYAVMSCQHCRAEELGFEAAAS